MPFLKILLFPFTLLYSSITSIRNFLFDKNIFKSVKFDLPVINVGNLTVGGTGKTPHVEYLIRLLKNEHKIATLSRGYGRKTKGFILANEKVSPEKIGDEPFQFYQKFKNDIQVSVGERRAEAVPYILIEKPEIKVILLDDAFQHRHIRPSLNILLTDYNRLFFKDLAFPAGRLRESKMGVKRADIVIVSKCPSDLAKQDKDSITKKIKKYTQAQSPIFFSSIRYAEILPFYETSFTFSKKDTEVLLITGIAQTQNLEDYIQSEFKTFKHLRFPDHYHYTLRDIEKIKKTFEDLENKQKILLCTEKDFVKLQAFKTELQQSPIFYLPIEIYFLENQDFFDNLLKSHVLDMP